MSSNVSGSLYVRLERDLYSALPQLRSVLMENSGDFASLKVLQRAEGDFLAILRRFSDKGDIHVLFANGFDFIGCLLSLEGAVASNRWRREVPWDKRKEQPR